MELEEPDLELGWETNHGAAEEAEEDTTNSGHQQEEPLGTLVGTDYRQCTAEKHYQHTASGTG